MKNTEMEPMIKWFYFLAEDWENFIQNNVDAGVQRVYLALQKYMVQDSMNIKDAVKFLEKSPEKMKF